MLSKHYTFLDAYTSQAQVLLQQHVGTVFSGVDYLSLALKTSSETLIIATNALTAQEQGQIILTDQYCQQMCPYPAHYAWLQVQRSQTQSSSVHYFWRNIAHYHLLFTLKSNQKQKTFVQQIGMQMERWFQLLDFWYMTWHDVLEQISCQTLPRIPCVFFDGLKWHMKLDDWFKFKQTPRLKLVK